MTDEPLFISDLVGLRCPTCRKWQTYVGRWDEDGYTWRCHGCLRAVGKCRCG